MYTRVPSLYCVVRPFEAIALQPEGAVAVGKGMLIDALGSETEVVGLVDGFVPSAYSISIAASAPDNPPFSAAFFR